MRAFSKSRRIFWNALMDFIKEERSEMRKRGTSVEEKKLRAEEKGRAVALLPIGVFLVLFLGMGIVFGDFYAMPAIVAFLIALLTAFLQNGKLTFADKMKVISAGIGDENIITMSLIFLCAGGFSGAVTAAGGVESTVNLGLSVLPPSIAVVGLFVIGCFISVSMGTSMGTIAAVKTQGCEMKDKFKANFLIVLPAAILTIVIFWLMTRNGSYQIREEMPYSIWKVLPYLVVLVGALAGINVFVVLISGIALSLIVGVATGSIGLSEIFNVVGDGVTGMYDITVISIIVACIVSLVREYGGIQFILNLIKSRIRGKRGGEFGIAVLALFVDLCTANNTIAIVMAGPIAKEISEEYDIDPKRSASLLDIFTSVGQGMIPYGAQLLSAATLTGLTPFDIIPNLFYPVLMGVSAILFIVFKKQN